MEFRFFETVAACGYTQQIQALLTLGDQEFIPPLSSRGSTTQSALSQAEGGSNGIRDYYISMCPQCVILALEEGRCLGFMSFRCNHTCEVIGPECLPNLYASTCVVHPDARGRGLMRGFYEEMIRLFPGRPIFTRTWHTNMPHLKVLRRLGFQELARLKDHRGPGLDTVYFCRQAEL